MKNVYLQILENESSHTAQALATVTSCVGSTPQKPGSSALFGLTGLLTGTIGGGAVEEELKETARQGIQSKTSGLYTFDLANEISEEQEPICGGKMTILLDADPERHLPVFREMKLSVHNRKPGLLLTKLDLKHGVLTGLQRHWFMAEGQEKTSWEPDPFTRNALKETLAEGQKGCYTRMEIPGEEAVLLLEPIFPLPRLVIAGAGHIGRALSQLGKLLGFEVTVIDDREEYANPKNIPDADTLLVEDTGKAFRDLPKTRDTYVVIVTRGHQSDADALKPCIGTELAYTGMIGSAKKVAEVRKKFIAEGWATPEQWNKIHAPIGLPINSRTVEEIAVSIAAQLVQVRNASLS